jgi:hypothetical protein
MMKIPKSITIPFWLWLLLWGIIGSWLFLILGLIFKGG